MTQPKRKSAAAAWPLADAWPQRLAEHLGPGQIVSTDAREFNIGRWAPHKPFHNLLA